MSIWPGRLAADDFFAAEAVPGKRGNPVLVGEVQLPGVLDARRSSSGAG